MTRPIRTIALAAAFVATAGASFAARQNSDQSVRNPLSIAMQGEADGSGSVAFQITNNSAQVLKVPYWQLPSGSAEGKLFQVLRNGKAATYLGPVVKRPAPTEADMVSFQPYETKGFQVNLAESYDMAAGGPFSVTYDSVLNGARTAGGRKIAGANGRLAGLRSSEVTVWVDGESALKAQGKGNVSGKGKPGSGGTVVGGITYVGCSSTQITDAGAGVLQARTYTQGARNYFATHASPTTRYTTWFGAFTTTRFSTATNHFIALDNALAQSGGQVKINCGCNQNYYAYVYPTKPYEIFVCRAFWTAPTSGTDSKGGTLIHETSHFNVVASTNDVVYGQTGSKSLAISDPDGALNNADSHEYFAENTPSQP
ncbi:M35 family metallo-endopeptidase [soil metagenome]